MREKIVRDPWTKKIRDLLKKLESSKKEILTKGKKEKESNE